jgi:hypothetical protein
MEDTPGNWFCPRQRHWDPGTQLSIMRFEAEQTQ